jgi:RHS repeat-associated protein
LGNETQRTYDLVSRLIEQTDPRGRSTRFNYDGLNRVTQITDALSGLTQFAYDGNGNLLSIADAKGQTTRYSYDVMDRLSSRTDPLSRAESYVYDPMGNLTQFTDRKGQVATFTYDGLNRRTQASYADGSRVDSVYDAAGRLTHLSDSLSGAINFTYDNLDRLIQEITAQGAVSYAYDVLGRRTSMAVNGQAPVNYGYDPASRLTQVAQASQIVGLGYDSLGRRTSLTYPNGTTTSYTYDAASYLTRILHQGPTAVVEDITYSYDAAGNRISFGRSGPQAALPAAVQAAYDAANQQIQFTSGTPNLTYDANGNLISQTDASGTTTYGWDARNRLAGLSGPNISATFVYDALGRRVSKTISGDRTEYQYDGNDIIAEIANGAVAATYLRSLNIDEPFVRQSTSTEFYHADALGSVLVSTDHSATIQTTYAYEPFGKTTSAGAPSTNPFQYTGRENDGSGLYYYRGRYYHTTLHRFINEDPLKVLRVGNLYQYAANSPSMFVDPSGLLEFTAFGGAGARVITPGAGIDAAFGLRSGTNGFGVGRVEGFGAARIFPAGGFAVGRNLFGGVAFRDVSDFSKLTEVFADTIIGSISLFFDGDQLVGIALGTPSVGFGVGIATPDTPILEVKAGINFPTLLPDLLGGLTSRGTSRRLLGMRKEQ